MMSPLREKRCRARTQTRQVLGINAKSGGQRGGGGARRSIKAEDQWTFRPKPVRQRKRTIATQRGGQHEFFQAMQKLDRARKISQAVGALSLFGLAGGLAYKRYRHNQKGGKWVFRNSTKNQRGAGGFDSLSTVNTVGNLLGELIGDMYASALFTRNTK